MKNTPVLLVAVVSLLLAAPAAQAQQGKTVPAVQNDKQGKNIQSKGVNPDPKKAKRKFIDPANMDLSVNPGDNFYLYANGNWIKNTPVPASKPAGAVLISSLKKAHRR